MNDLTPDGLGARGKDLWEAVSDEHTLDIAQRQLLLEACRTADNLDGLNAIVTGKSDWMELMRFRTKRDADDQIEVSFDNVLSEQRQQQNVFKQLLAAMRLPDQATGKKPQQRGGARGSYTSNGAGAGTATSKVSSLDRARAAKAGA